MMDKETELRIKYCGMKQSKLAKAAIQLEKEADWLAWNCETLSGYNPILRQGMSKTQWREAAREAIKNVEQS